MKLPVIQCCKQKLNVTFLVEENLYIYILLIYILLLCQLYKFWFSCKQKLVRVYSNGCRIFISYLTMQFDFEYTEHATMLAFPYRLVIDGAVVMLVTLLYFTLLLTRILV